MVHSSPRGLNSSAQANGLGLKIGHSRRARLEEAGLSFLSSGGSHHGFVGGGQLASGKFDEFFSQLLAQERDQIQAGGPFGCSPPLWQGFIVLSALGSIAFEPSQQRSRPGIG